jgi:hypothetical protein
MDLQSKAALQQLGARYILGELVNVPAPEDIKNPDAVHREHAETGSVNSGANSKSRAQDFINRCGRLRPWVSEAGVGGAITDVIVFANLLRTAWTVPRTKAVIADVNFALNMIFQSKEPARPIYGGPEPDADPEPALFLQADFGSGKLKPVPRTLLDTLAIELIQAHRMLQRCHNPSCGRLFVKAYSRDHYCSPRCGDLMRGEGQRRWAEKHREELNRKRRTAKRGPRSKSGIKHMAR